MARKGENIYKRKDGRWEGRYIKSRSSTGKANYGYVYAKSYRECYSNLNHTSAAHTTPPVTGVLPLCTRLRRVRRNNPPWRSL